MFDFAPLVPLSVLVLAGAGDRVGHFCPVSLLLFLSVWSWA